MKINRELVLGVFFIALFILVAMNMYLCATLAGGDVNLYWTLLKENHFEILQWIHDSR